MAKKSEFLIQPIPTNSPDSNSTVKRPILIPIPIFPSMVVIDPQKITWIAWLYPLSSPKYRNIHNLISQLLPSLMAASVLACLFFIFFLPCFSNSCTTELPCDSSIQIKPPFYFQSNITADLNCSGYLPVGCDNNDKPFLIWLSLLFPLESISDDKKTITVQDPDLRSSLEKIWLS